MRIEELVPYSEAAREAREKFSITPTQVPNLSSARAGFVDVFMGVAFTCGAEEQVIPFLDRGLSVEYELARSLRVVANTERKKIGVVTTRQNCLVASTSNLFEVVQPGLWLTN